jgi:uncharacterized protein (DUF924 family)
MISEVLDYWFGAPITSPEMLGARMRRWFMGGPAMDAEIISRFGALTETAVTGKHADWAATDDGRLALILVLDQFTRSVFRDNARMYEGDAAAQKLTLDRLEQGVDAWPAPRKNFFLMPLVHAENLAMQDRGVVELERLVAAAPQNERSLWSMGIEQTRKYQGVIKRFGRFPHRNKILGRASTPEELEFLKDWAAKQPPSNAPNLPTP